MKLLFGIQPDSLDSCVIEVAEIEDTTEVTTEDTTETTTEEPEEGFDDPELVSDGSPVIRLKTHYVNIQVGDDFYSMDYV